MWLRSKVGISGGSAKLVANVILQNQEKERNNANGCLPSLSHPLATKVRKKNQKMTMMMNMLFAIIVVHLVTNIIAKKEKNKVDEHASTSLSHSSICTRKKIKKNIIPLML